MSTVKDVLVEKSENYRQWQEGPPLDSSDSQVMKMRVR